MHRRRRRPPWVRHVSHSSCSRKRQAVAVTATVVAEVAATDLAVAGRKQPREVSHQDSNQRTCACNTYETSM